LTKADRTSAGNEAQASSMAGDRVGALRLDASSLWKNIKKSQYR
jgi:hypothetical protein